MKKIIEFIVLFLILSIGNAVAPQYILSIDWKTTLFAAIICMVISIVTGALVGFVTIFIALDNFKNFRMKQYVLTVVCTILISFTIPTFGLWVCSRFIPGFAVQGIFTYVLLTIIINIFHVTEKKVRTING